jgi:hypothetical protein
MCMTERAPGIYCEGAADAGEDAAGVTQPNQGCLGTELGWDAKYYPVGCVGIRKDATGTCLTFYTCERDWGAAATGGDNADPPHWKPEPAN